MTHRTIQHIERLYLSRNGNPRFRFTFTDGSAAISSSDCAFCYGVGNPDMREGCKVEVTFTRSGRINHMEPTR